jgi:HK97 family phage prohead protease
VKGETTVEQKNFGLALDAVSESGIFTGKLSTYGNKDRDNEVVDPGAFSGSPTRIPALWSHNADLPIGDLELEDRPDALYVKKGRLVLSVPQAQIAYELLKAGVVKSMSIGFSVPAGGAYYSKDGVRHLRKIDLYEGSIVVVPANPLAVIDSVKSHRDQDFSFVIDTLKTNIDALKHEADVKRTVETFFALARAERALGRISKLI